MRLLTKFSLAFAGVFGTGLGAAGLIFHGQLQGSAREQVLHHAQIMMETALAMRNYTTEQVAPALNESQPQVEASADDIFRELCKRKAAKRVFRPQQVPAFAATEMFNYLRKAYPDYVYKEAALNPTNPRDRAAEWEEDIIKVFRGQPELKAFDGERMTPFGRSLFLAKPMRAQRSCLQCHSTPTNASAEMLALYGPANGFGWRENEVIAAQIVSVPVALPVEMANRAFGRLVISMVVVAGVTLILLNVVLFLTVIRPVSRFAAAADEISRGNMEVPELPVKGRDEISVLAAAFNRMYRSLSAAMKMLDKQ